MKKIIVSIFFLVACQSAGAELIKMKSVGCDTVSGTCFILLEDAYGSQKCQGDNLQIRFDQKKEGFKNQWPIVISAFVAEKPLYVVSTSCYEERPTPAYLYMGK